MASPTPDHLPKAPSSNTVTLGVKAAVFGLGDTVQSSQCFRLEKEQQASVKGRGGEEERWASP